MEIKRRLKELFRTKCKLPHVGDKATNKLNERLRAVEDHIKQRATVNGEDQWFLVMKQHPKNGDCK